MNRWLPIALTLASAVLLCFAVAQSLTPIFRASEMTLGKSRGWTSTKRLVEMGLNGAMPYQEGTQALAGEQLNLHPWHGFQEVVLRNEVVPREIQFRFLLGENAYLYFLFDRRRIFPVGTKPEQSYQAVRLSASPEYPNGLFGVDGRGGFTSGESLNEPPLAPERWHTARLVFEGNDAGAVFLDGRAISLPTRWSNLRPMYIGFRGSAHKAVVDDVIVEQANGRPVIREHFVDEAAARRTWLRIAALSCGIEALVLLLVTAMVRDWRARVSLLLSMGITAAACAFITGQFYTRVQAHAYPAFDKTLEAQEFRHVRSLSAQTRENLINQYTRTPAPGVLRVVVLGSSQTTGWGASQREETFTNQLENMLAEALGRPVECIAAAVPGATSELLTELYEAEWCNFGQVLTVVNLSVNDQTAEPFAENLRRIVAANRARNIKTLFALEPTSPEIAPNGDTEHAAMRTVAEERHVPLFDLHAAMRAHTNEGMLWWDVVHPTSFGHYLIAKELLTPVLDVLGANTSATPQ